MLRGTKPLAYFSSIVGDDPECLVRYWRLFDKYVVSGRLIKREVIKPISQGHRVETRSVLYALAGEEWRIDAMLELLSQPGAWTPEKERRFGELLGYLDWQNDYWLQRRSQREEH